MTTARDFTADTLLASLRGLADPATQNPALKQRLEARLAISLVGLGPAVTAGSAVNTESVVTARPTATSDGGTGGAADLTARDSSLSDVAAEAADVTARGSSTSLGAATSAGSAQLLTTSSFVATGHGVVAQLRDLAAARSQSVIVAHSKTVIASWIAAAFIGGAVSGVVLDRWHRSHGASAQHATMLQKPESANLTPAPAELGMPRTNIVELLQNGTPNTAMDVTAPPKEPTESTQSMRALPARGSSGTASPNDARVMAAPSGADAPTPEASGDDASATALGGETRDSLAVERQLLDAARTALSRGEPLAGVASLERHVKRFPKGTLAEEREALYVRILVAAGNAEAAELRAANFERRFPGSIFMPVVERAIASITRRNTETDSKP